MAVASSKHTALGGFYPRIKARRGPMIAMKATARKLAVLFYHMMTKDIQFVEEGLLRHQQRYEEQLRKRLAYQAYKLGFTLAPIQAVQ